VLPLAILPAALDLGEEAPTDAYPPLWLWGVLALHLGVPFFLVASTGPLLQRWFAEAGHNRSSDPYFLYAASNLGSLIGLLAYPFVVEPSFDLDEQAELWTAGYALLAVLAACAAVWLWSTGTKGEPSPVRGRVTAEHDVTRPLTDLGSPVEPPTRGLRARWVALAVVPSSLMLSVTLHITTDLAAIPLLWVLPLSLYLCSFILVFVRWHEWLHRPLLRIMPIAVVVLVVVYLTEAAEPILIVVGLYLAGFFVIALVCHGELSRSRPAASYLTEFYLWLALGGVLGGLLNTLVAPLLFSSVAEFPLGLIAACLLCPGQASTVKPWRDPLLIAIAATSLILVIASRWLLEIPAGPISVAAMFGLPLLLCYAAHEKPQRFATGIGIIFSASLFYPGVHGQADYRVRSFFGVHRVTHDDHFRYLVHGDTVHGQQSLLAGEEDEPRTYYHRNGPIGKLFAALAGDPRLDRVGLVGLGTGALACYAQPKQHWTFFEIDPDVIDIASNPDLFTYLKRCKGRVDIEPGDARLSLKRRDDKFGLIVVDAFSSDAIPVHLLTREAMTLYKDRLRPGGLLAFHVSNRYLDLQPILANLAADGERPMTCLARADHPFSDADAKRKKAIGWWPSQWVVLALDKNDTAKLKWQVLRPNPHFPIWTDRYSNLFQIMGHDRGG
jgi:SAM-dependent methyltransferase